LKEATEKKGAHSVGLKVVGDKRAGEKRRADIPHESCALTQYSAWEQKITGMV